MAVSNHERVGKALELLNQGLKPYIEREMKAAFGDRWLYKASDFLRDHHYDNDGNPRLDTQALLLVMWGAWNEVFRTRLGQAERTYVSELREVRNQWAHQTPFATDDAYRALDSMERLLRAVSAPEAQEVEKAKQELLRIRFEEQARKETRKAAGTATNATPQGGLKPWREIVTPHPDVASGRYQQAEFAADLNQVHRGEGSDEYRIPKEFYRRTFVTEGLKHLLTNALRRLTGQGGDPVVELQTNFGGGKTHSMLALYHMVSGVSPGDLTGIEGVVEAAGVAQLPKAKVAVLVGTALSPGIPQQKPDGTVTRTLWGEMAWQLLGKEGYKIVADADERSVSPGSDALCELFKKAGTTLILIDEWVAYVRQLFKIDGLPGGSFEANITFAQSLTEAAKASPNTLVVASIPQSLIEIGGDGGQEALQQLKNVFGRVESAWRPASAEEGFEIVRRRLFQPITDTALFKARDGVVRAFGEMYRAQPQEFPASCREADYERRMAASYPIHPELFDRLYIDWSSLDKFQRTRGVLRLMAAVIHELWIRQDGNLMILPATIPIDAAPVQFELTRYMDDPWVPVIEKDIDGPVSKPLELDQENPNLGRYSACRRVARALYLGSAPTLHTANKGLEERSIKLACVQPGEAVATFGDALRRLTDQATHLYVDGKRYWYSTQPSVTRLAQDRALQQNDDMVAEEIKKRLKVEQDTKGDFVAIHLAPSSTSDVLDQPEARLVILSPEEPHSSKNDNSKAMATAKSLLEHRGSGPRLYRNALVYLAPDQARLTELMQATRQYLAWKSIESEKDALNLDAFQTKQAKTKREDAEDRIKLLIKEAYIWLLVPHQDEPLGPVEWHEIKLQGQEELAVRASKKLKNDGLLLTVYEGTNLRLELDKIPLWRGDHVTVKQLTEDFAQYLYLSRFKSPEILIQAVQKGVASLAWTIETFAYADFYDEAQGRYMGLKTGTYPNVVADGKAVVVRPDAAMKQFNEDAAKAAATQPGGEVVKPIPGTGTGTSSTEGTGGTTIVAPPPPKVSQPRRFYTSVQLDPARLTRDAGQIADAIVQHIQSLYGASVRITLEIDADVPDGMPENTVRTVKENCNTLKIEPHFED